MAIKDSGRRLKNSELRLLSLEGQETVEQRGILILFPENCPVREDAADEPLARDDDS